MWRSDICVIRFLRNLTRRNNDREFRVAFLRALEAGWVGVRASWEGRAVRVRYRRNEEGAMVMRVREVMGEQGGGEGSGAGAHYFNAAEEDNGEA